MGFIYNIDNNTQTHLLSCCRMLSIERQPSLVCCRIFSTVLFKIVLFVFKQETLPDFLKYPDYSTSDVVLYKQTYRGHDILDN